MEDSMRARFAGRWVALSLFLAVCGGCKQGQGHAPPPLDKQLFIGKWEADEPEQFIQALEFGTDNTFTMRIKSMPETVPGKYAWTGETRLTLEYQLSEELQKKTKAALAEVKAKIRERGEKAPGTTGPAIANSAKQYPDELPAKEELRVGLSDRYGPVLILSTESALHFQFKKPKTNGQ
jgi:hypothetical protein